MTEVSCGPMTSDKILWVAAELDVPVILFIIHTVCFFLRAEMRNLPGKNLAYFCCNRLLAYVTFQIGHWMSDNREICSRFHALAYYFTMTSLCSSLTISYDLQRTLKKSLHLSPNPIASQLMAYRLYFVFSTCVPLLFIVPAAVMQNVFFCQPMIKLDCNDHFCLFNCDLAIYVFLVTPLSLMIVITAYLSVYCGFMVYYKNQRQQSILYKYRKKFFLKHSTLTVLCACNTAFYTYQLLTNESFAGKLGFGISNWILGFYVFVVFTCKQNWQYFRHLISLPHRQCLGVETAEEATAAEPPESNNNNNNDIPLRSA